MMLYAHPSAATTPPGNVLDRSAVKWNDRALGNRDLRRERFSVEPTLVRTRRPVTDEDRRLG